MRRVHRRDSENDRVSRFFAWLPSLPCVSAFRDWVIWQVEGLDTSIPHSFLEPFLLYAKGLDMLRATLLPLLYGILDSHNALAHVSIISTRSRTVQKVFVTPAAIAGVQRIAMLDFTKL